MLAAVSSATNRPDVVEQPDPHELGRRRRRGRSRRCRGARVSDHARARARPPAISHDLDGAVRGAHAAADLRRLERRAAGAAVQTSRSAEPSAISQFVPTSMNSRSRLSRFMPVASSPATMSPPTYAPSAGKTFARARGCRRRPSSAAGRSG